MNWRAAAAVGLVISLAGCVESPASPPVQPQASFNGIDLTGAEWGKDFQLTDHRGQDRTMKDFRGKVVMLFFGYLNCPDMCPTAVAQMAKVRSKMGSEADRVQGLFVTLDPKRDRPEILEQYLGSFDPSFLGLRANDVATAAAAREFKVFYAAQPAGPSGSYTVDHSGGVYLLDGKGRLRLMVRPGASVEAMANDVHQLLRETL